MATIGALPWHLPSVLLFGGLCPLSGTSDPVAEYKTPGTCTASLGEASPVNLFPALGSVSQATDSGTCFPLRCLLCWVFGNYTSLVTPIWWLYTASLLASSLILSPSLKLLLPQTFWDCSLDYMPWGQLAGCCLPYKRAIFFFSWFWRLCFFSWSQWNTAFSVIIIYFIPIAPKV